MFATNRPKVTYHISYTEVSITGTSPDQVQILDFFMSRFLSGTRLETKFRFSLNIVYLKNLKIKFGKLEKIKKFEKFGKILKLVKN